MFSKSAKYYDAIYAFKDYAGESERLEALIHSRAPQAHTLLDVACGTGMHISQLKRWFGCEGLDLDASLLAVAREHNPEVPFHQGDMITFSLGKQFDVVTCLFSAIGYCADTICLDKCVAAMARHLNPKGLLIIEPWITPEHFKAGHLGSLFVDKDDLKVARFNLSRVEGNRAIMDFHYLIGTPEGIHYEVEEHRTTLFTGEQYQSAIQRAGLEVEFDAEGLMGRGLYVGLAS